MVAAVDLPEATAQAVRHDPRAVLLRGPLRADARQGRPGAAAGQGGPLVPGLPGDGGPPPRRRRQPAAARLLLSRGRVPGRARSEEHTSDLKSIMRASYAVFYLKTKIKQLHI